MICACGHGPSAHTAPAGPCALCTEALKWHRHTPMPGDFGAELETALLAHLDSMETP